MVEIIEIINIVGSVIGTFFYYLNKRFQSRLFREDFKEFKNELERHFNKDLRPEIVKLAQDNLLTLEEFNKRFSSQLNKLNAINNMAKEYMRIRDKIKFIGISFLISLVMTLIKLVYPLFNIGGLEPTIISFWILIGGIGLIVYVLWSLDKLERNISRFNLGEPIDKILDDIIGSNTTS